ncbi:hypothetical protein [Brevibacillus reuszeri]|uniref:hypothetical protein n=1 Tax=Brevibacillus reuszeri TaxID=54915 RepID=UPI0013E04522|nr:hypothetical protein [Brevibacillus reuszeri]
MENNDKEKAGEMVVNAILEQARHNAQLAEARENYFSDKLVDDSEANYFQTKWGE